MIHCPACASEQDAMLAVCPACKSSLREINVGYADQAALDVDRAALEAEGWTLFSSKTTGATDHAIEATFHRTPPIAPRQVLAAPVVVSQPVAQQTASQTQSVMNGFQGGFYGCFGVLAAVIVVIVGLVVVGSIAGGGKAASIAGGGGPARLEVGGTPGMIFTGAILDGTGTRSVSGKTPASYSLTPTSIYYSVSFQKGIGSFDNGTLDVALTCNGHTSRNSTTAQYGVVAVTCR